MEALAYLHSDSVRVIHKDIKPANILLSGDLQTVKLADFGVCTRLQKGEKYTNKICGTPNYLAPELSLKHKCSFPADIWAMGCLLYAMITGKPPFNGKTSDETIRKAQKGVYSMPQNISKAC